ncbi:hypothetical protein OL548_10660 [Lysinibacillus sp. MHQ-1]|nr:hypothetical protein OL548_10660 [Lysinibacillus sp. MHQ-1]
MNKWLKAWSIFIFYNWRLISSTTNWFDIDSGNNKKMYKAACALNSKDSSRLIVSGSDIDFKINSVIYR